MKMFELRRDLRREFSQDRTVLVADAEWVGGSELDSYLPNHTSAAGNEKMLFGLNNAGAHRFYPESRRDSERENRKKDLFSGAHQKRSEAKKNSRPRPAL